jgi:hypothetical protein
LQVAVWPAVVYPTQEHSSLAAQLLDVISHEALLEGTAETLEQTLLVEQYNPDWQSLVLSQACPAARE